MNLGKNKRKLRIVGLCAAALLLFLLCRTPRFDRPISTVVEDRNGELLGATVAADGQWRFPPMDHVPDKFVRALLAYEDRRFFLHPGVDPIAVTRALRDNLRKQEVVSGASTLTMQVVRLSRHGRSRTLPEKMIEMVLALRLEWAKSKKEILALYASHAPFGGNVVGLEAASWRYFGRPPQQLSWAEAAMLAVLPNSPSLIHPGRNRVLLKEKRDRLLLRLRQTGQLDSLTCALACREPLPDKPYPLPMTAPHIVQRLKNGRSGSRFRTTLDQNLQKQSLAVARRHLAKVSANGIHNIAAVIVRVDSGTVAAYLGNVTQDVAEHSPSVDIITAPRSTGSLLKPLLYAGMLEASELLPTTLVPDIPTQMGGFAPQNYSRGYEGAVPAARALARSLNVPAVRMLHRFGVDRFYDLLKSLGMSTLFRPAQDYGLTLILGGAEGSLWDLTSIYAGLARGACQPTGRSPFFAPRLLADDDKKKPAADSPLSPTVCWFTLAAMREVTRPGEEQNWELFTSSQEVAWKTGTSFGFRDGWAIGVTPEYAVGVWLGNADGEGRPGLTGIGAAAPLMFDLFHLLETTRRFQKPKDMQTISICAKSGWRAGPFCEKTEEIEAPSSGLLSALCPYCRIVHCDSTGRRQVNAECEPVAAMKNVSWFVLPPTMEWFYRQKHSDYLPLPPLRDDCLAGDSEKSASMSLIRHQQPSAVYVPIELDGERGRVVFEAAHRNSTARIFWHLDDNYLTTTQGFHQIAVAPAAGQHRLTLVDENGERLTTRFQVLEK